jgi:LmbE family N-acetylglucosaminyl deacetylase
MKTILVIGAHYDDAELGVGGSMAKWRREGKTVYKLTLSDNATNFKQKNITVIPDEAKAESAKACEVLGVWELKGLVTLQDCTTVTYQKEQMQLIEAFILENKVDTLVMHNVFDIQQDHIHAATISYVAGRYCDNILMYQSNKYVLPVDFYPRYFVDITAEMELKNEALACYSSEHDRYLQLFDNTTRQNQVDGYRVNMNKGIHFAEAFKILKFTER